MTGMFTQTALEKRLRQLEEDLRIAQEDSKAPREIITSLSKSLEALTTKKDNDAEMRDKLDLLLTKMDKQSEEISGIKKELSNNSEQIEILKNQQNNIVKTVQGLEQTVKDKTEALINIIETEGNAYNMDDELLKITTKVGNCETLTTQLKQLLNDLTRQFANNEDVLETKKLVEIIKEKVYSTEANASDSVVSKELDQISSNISNITENIEKIKRDTAVPLKILTDKIPSVKTMTDNIKYLECAINEALAKGIEDLKYERVEYQCRICSKKLPESQDLDKAFVVCPSCHSPNLVGKPLKHHRWIKMTYCEHFQQLLTNDLDDLSNVTCKVCGEHGKAAIIRDSAAPFWKSDDESEADD